MPVISVFVRKTCICERHKGMDPSVFHPSFFCLLHYIFPRAIHRALTIHSGVHM